MLHDADETEDILFLGRHALRKLPYRKKLGLPAIKVGKRLMFHSDDIDKVVKAGRESFGVNTEEDELSTTKQRAKPKA